MRTVEARISNDPTKLNKLVKIPSDKWCKLFVTEGEAIGCVHQIYKPKLEYDHTLVTRMYTCNHGQSIWLPSNDQRHTPSGHAAESNGWWWVWAMTPDGNPYYCHIEVQYWD